MGVVEIGKGAAFSQQFGEATALDDIAVAQDKNEIRRAHGREPVGDDERGAAGSQPRNAFHHQRLGLDVKRRGRLVEN